MILSAKTQPERSNQVAKITVPMLQTMKEQGERIAMLTCYDASFAKLYDEVGVDISLVGDSLGMVIHGCDNTVPVTIQDVRYHVEAVSRGNTKALLMADLPYMTFSNVNDAIKSSAILIQAGAEIVKIEGGEWLADTVYQLTLRGIPVCAHIGLACQSVHLLGGHKVQGREESEAQQIIQDAKVLAEAGARLVLLECVPYPLAAQITELLKVPTIGIGAGPYCDGQVLVMHDMLGLGNHYKFTKDFLTGEDHGVAGAVRQYVTEVKNNEFPSLEHSFS